MSTARAREAKLAVHQKRMRVVARRVDAESAVVLGILVSAIELLLEKPSMCKEFATEMYSGLQDDLDDILLKAPRAVPLLAEFMRIIRPLAMERRC